MRVYELAKELGIAQAFMDMMAKMLANPYKLAQAQMNLVWDYFSLWQDLGARVDAAPPSGSLSRRSEPICFRRC